MSTRIGIVGAGVGGLTLAHALRRRGMTPVIFERTGRGDPAAGYRLHLEPEACRDLAAGLPAQVYARLRASGAGAEAFQWFTLMDHRGRTRARLPVPTDGDRLLIERRVFLEILRDALPSDVIRWDTPVTGYRTHADGVTVHYHPGGAATVDVLVGADGTRSVITPQLVGLPPMRSTGITAIAAQVWLDQAGAPAVPTDLRDGLAYAIGPRGVGLFMTLQQAGPARRPFVLWSLGARIDQFAAYPSALSGSALVAEAARLVDGWSPRFAALIGAADVGTASAYPFWMPAALDAWATGPASGRVTLLGDAIHPMPPTAGVGAGTAIFDAVALAAELDEARTGAQFAVALHRYRDKVAAGAPRAVAKGRPALTGQRVLSHAVARWAATGVGMPAVGWALQARYRRRPHDPSRWATY